MVFVVVLKQKKKKFSIFTWNVLLQKCSLSVEDQENQGTDLSAEDKTEAQYQLIQKWKIQHLF